MSGIGSRNPMYPGVRELPGQLMNNGLQPTGEGMRFRFGGLLTYEKPVVEFFPDINIGINENRTLIAGQDLPRNCVNMRFISVVGAPYISINGGGGRLLLNGDTLSGVEIRTLQIVTGAADSAVIQSAGTGD